MDWLEAHLEKIQNELAKTKGDLGKAQGDLAKARVDLEKLRHAYRGILEELVLMRRRLFAAKSERKDTSTEQLVFDGMLAEAVLLASAHEAAEQAEREQQAEQAEQKVPGAPDAPESATTGGAGGLMKGPTGALRWTKRAEPRYFLDEGAGGPQRPSCSSRFAGTAEPNTTA